MTVPANPTVDSIVTDALRHAGIFNPSVVQIIEMTNGGFQTVKTDIWAACTNDELLKTVTMIVLSQGNGQVDTPSDFSSAVRLDVYSATDAMSFTATAGAASSITAPSTFSAEVSSIRGLYVFTVSGTGSGQYRQITNYDDTTKVLSIAPAWSVNPASGTVAFVGHLRKQLTQWQQEGTGYLPSSPNQGHPSRYHVVGSSPLNTDIPAIEVFPVPDTANYALLLTYIPNLTRLDEAGTIFVKHLRERRSLWINGLIDQACRRYDEARYPAGYQTWQVTLQRHASHSQYYSRLEPGR
jgi:hypothetical protein